MSDKNNEESTADTLKVIQEDVKKLKSALPKDEYDEPDYAGHRKFHRDITTNEADSKKKRSEIQVSIVTWVVMAIVTIILSLLINGSVDISKLMGK